MRIFDLIEAPLASYDTHGDWSDREENVTYPVQTRPELPDGPKNSFLSKRDRILATKPETKERLKSMLFKGPENYRYAIHVLNDPALIRFITEYLDFGRIDIGNPVLRELEADGYKTLTNIVANRKANEITFVLTHNDGGDVRHPLTPWIIMHRCAHALPVNSSEVSKITGTMFNRIRATMPDHYLGYEVDAIRDFMRAIYTFKSGREGKVEDDTEEAAELMTQFMVRGEIIFNPAPERLTFKAGDDSGETITWVDPDHEETQRMLDFRRQYIERQFKEILDDAIGGVYVC